MCEFAVVPAKGFRWKYFFSVWLTNKQSPTKYERRMIKIFTDASEGLDLVHSASVQFETSPTNFQLLSVWGALYRSCC